MIRWLWRAASLVVLIAIGFGLVSMALAEEAKSAGTEKPQVLYLHTEFLPYQQDADKKYANRLSRELARQAVLIAARDGLGVQTCDETLDEVPATDAELVQLALTERLNSDGKWRIKLAKFVEGQNAYAVQSLWEKTYDCPTAVEKIYADVVPKLEVDSRGEMVEALKLAGLKDAKKEAKSAAPDKAASGEVEQRLLMPDFIAQFGVVRSAHQAMQAKRESPERLGYLARGYANLASLTKHHWSSATEVFTARAWLYAQRMVAGDEKSALALWNRAYAWALGGSVRDALADVERVDKLAAAANGGSQGELAWTKLVKPFASFDRAAMKKLGADTAELKPWAAYLHFELCNFARYAEWMFDAVGDVGKSCPMAYGVYAEMAHHGRMLAVIRTGAGTAPKAFGYFAPISLGGLADLPKSIRELLPTDEEKREALEKLVNDPNPKDDFSAVLGFFAEKLREAARQHGDGDLSWSVLASLLDEETFVEAALFMKVSTNATEMSLQGLVDSLLPLVKKHRYASFVECFSLGNVRDPGRLYDYFGTLAVRDPRANMISMFQRIGYLKNAQGESIGPMLIANTSRTFTAPGMVEFLFALGPGAFDGDDKLDPEYAYEFEAIAPKSPIATRLHVQAATAPTADDLKRWEGSADGDPQALLLLGRAYLTLGDNEGAVRCLDKSIAELPTSEAAMQLAGIYRQQGDMTKWKETLESFLKTEDLGLQHSAVQLQLAIGLTHVGDWRSAKPYALAAAQTYSQRGLDLGSYVTEGLAEWELSEQLMRAEATSYPSFAGANWYMWCRRTGRGDVKSAQQLAAQYFSLPQPHPNDNTYLMNGMYALLLEDTKSARDAFNQSLGMRRTFTSTYLVAQLSRELKDEQTRTQVIDAMEQEVKNPAKPNVRTPEVDGAGTAVLDVIKSGDLSAERLARVDETLLKLGENALSSSTGFCYFIGNELESAGRAKEAEKYWRRALISPDRNPIVATLAGVKLAKYNGTSRPDDDALDADDLWPPAMMK